MSSQKLSGSALFYLSLYWFSINFHWGALLTVVIPAEVLRFVADAEKAKYLGLVFFAGAFIAMVTQPIIGAISDRSGSTWGRRRPYILAGGLANCLALLGMAYSPKLSWFVVAFLLVQFFNNVSGSAYQALIPDLVPEDQRGTASGLMGVMTMLGTILSLALAGIMLGQGARILFYWVIVGIMMAGILVTMFKVKEIPYRYQEPWVFRQFLASFWVSPRQFPDFAWLWVSRALIMLGFYTLLNFLEYYLKDVTGLVKFIEATTGVGAAVMVGAAVSTFFSGWLSDRIGRRIIVFTAGMLMGVTALTFLAGPAYEVILGVAVVFGIGYGAFISVDWALAVDVLPSARSAGKDMGLWGISVTLPQVIAPLIGGQVLYYFHPWGGHWEYKILYLIAFAYFLAGSLGVWKIRKAK